MIVEILSVACVILIKFQKNKKSRTGENSLRNKFLAVLKFVIVGVLGGLVLLLLYALLMFMGIRQEW